MFFAFVCGCFIGCMFFEPIIINLIYFKNLDLFFDIILWPKNRKKLISYVKN